MKAVAGAHQKYLIGCRPGRATKYAVLDIDAGSRYHNVPAVDALRALLKHAGLEKTMVYRSSFSEGWHLYIFFEEAVSSRDLSNQLNQLLKFNDFEIKKGTLEVFPQPGIGSNGQGLRVPLQDGFAWLDQKTLEVENERFEYSAINALELFVDALNGCANTKHQFHNMKAYVAQLTSNTLQAQERIAKKEFDNVVPLKMVVSEPDTSSQAEIMRVFQVTPPGMNVESWIKGRNYFNRGLTGPSQRADAIFCLGHYLFYGDPENKLSALGYGLETERKEVIETILSERHHGNSSELNRERVDALKQVERATAWLPPSRRNGDKPQSSFEMPTSWVRHNANLKSQARSRIQAAVEHFQNVGLAFSSRELSEKSNCSRTTLYKHQDLWRPAYLSLQEQTSVSGPHEYNAVSEFVSLETEFFESVLSEEADGSGSQESCLVADLSYRRTSKVVSAWITPVLKLLSNDFVSVDSSQLLFLSSTLKWFVSVAPTVSTKDWLLAYLKKLDSVLVQKRFEFVFSVGSKFVSDGSMYKRYTFARFKSRSQIARSLSDEFYSGETGKHPPPS